MYLKTSIIAVVLLFTSQKSFVDTLPYKINNNLSGQDEDVEELQGLKILQDNLNHKSEFERNERTPKKEKGNLEIPFPDITNLSQSTHSPTFGENSKDDNKLSLPSTVESESKSVKNLEDASNANAMQFTPGDIAEYIFWTGDEKGVTVAVNEFLKEGFMTREEAVDFLQEIQQILEYLRTLYGQLGLGTEKLISKDKSPNLINNEKNKYVDKRPEILRFKINHMLAKRLEDILSGISPESHQNNLETDPASWKYKAGLEDLEKIRETDLFYTEYALEEVIHQLAKVIFKQYLTQGNKEAKEAFEKFTFFLEKQVEKNQISVSLEKKILDVLISALSEVLREHPIVAHDLLTSPQTQENNIALGKFLEKYQYKLPPPVNFLPYKIMQKNISN